MRSKFKMPLSKSLGLSLASLVLAAFCLTLTPTFPTQALDTTKPLKISTLIEPALNLSQSNCDSITNPNTNQLTLTVSPSSPFDSDCQDLSIDTNAPGYSLSIQASTHNTNYNSDIATNNLLYTDVIFPTPFPIIAATANSLASPATLTTPSTWGFAITSNNVNPATATTQYLTNFQPYANYSPNNTANTYANPPLTATTLYHSEQFPAQTDVFRFYYATFIDAFTVPGHYGATVTYSVVAEDVVCPYDSDLVYDDVRCVEPTYMQDFTVSDCDTMALNQIITLTDERDGKEYNIIKLKMSSDGTNDKCWMQQNLALENKTLTPADSNVASNFTLGAAQTTAPANSYDVTDPAYATTTPANSGYLYNWATAIAYDSTVYGGSDSQDITAGNAQYSICPKGWRLPVGGPHTTGSTTGTNEFALVDVNSYGGTGGNRYPDATTLAEWTNASGFAAVYAGYFYGGSFSGQGLDANFWSSSVNSDTNAYSLYLYSTGSYVFPQYNGTKFYGFSVRCVFGG